MYLWCSMKYTIWGKESILYFIILKPCHLILNTRLPNNTKVTDCTVEWLQPSPFFFHLKTRKGNTNDFLGNWFPWLSGLRGCVTCKHYAALLFEILNCFGVCVCAGTRPLLSGADKNQAWMVYWFLDFEVTSLTPNILSWSIPHI